jgi:hypothetical protein
MFSTVDPGRPAEPSGEIVQRLAHELLPHSGDISAQITAQVLAALPRLAPDSAPDAVAAVREATDQNIGAILSTLAFGVPATATEPPLGARRLMHRSLAAGADITDLLRAYRYGHELIWQRWSTYVSERLPGTDPAGGSELLARVLARSSAHIFTFIDRSCDHLVAEYRAEFGALRPSAADRPPAEVVRELLDDGAADESSASSLLRHDIGGYHVALILAPLDAAADPRAALADISADAAAATLILPVGDGTWWAWLTWAAAPDQQRLARLAELRCPGVLVAMGGPGKGRAGFRRSHREARDADRTARLSRRPVAGVVRHRELELAGLLCHDPDRAQRLAADRLGALARPDETSQRLRDTLLTYLAHGCNKTQTAAVLHVHHKTVSYRLGQAERLLGRPLTDAVLELGSALLIHRTLHGS